MVKKMMTFLSITNSIYKIHSIIWNKPLVFFFLFIGIFYTIALGFVPFTHISSWINIPFKKNTNQKDNKSITQYQALTTALAATIGTGSIAGVATAIAAGGPGAIFWMWISAILGMSTSFAEKTLGIIYRRKDSRGNWLGGPMYYLENGLHSKSMAKLYAFFCIFASLGIGNMTQCNSISLALNDTFSIPLIITGIILCFITLIIIIGGLKRIAAITEKLIPFMAFFYLLGCGIIIIVNIDKLLPVLITIFREAFNFRAPIGGLTGYAIVLAMKNGISKGVFSNEAGLGSSVIVHAASNVSNPCEQGLWGIFEVFADTIVFCTASALVILTSGIYDADKYLYAIKLDNLNNCTSFFDSLPNGVAMTCEAFASVFGSFGNVFIAISITLFAFSTLVGWSYYGQSATNYLFGSKSSIYYKLIYCFVIIVGSVTSLNLVWCISDSFNGLMAIPNLIALLFLSNKVIKISKEYFKK